MSSLPRPHRAGLGVALLVTVGAAGAACASSSPAGTVPVPRAGCVAAGADTARAWPAADLDRPTRPLPNNPAPTYPSALRAQGMGGEVVVAFVTDTLGRPEPCSIRVVRATDPAFAGAVAAVLPRYRFEAGVRQGRKVRQAWELPFTFALGS